MPTFLHTIGFFLLTIFCVLGSQAVAEEDAGEGAREDSSVYVAVDASTWKTRGRLLYDIEGSILKKLTLAGFEVVRESTKPHQFTLLVTYREDQGEQYAVNAYGTIINSEFQFHHGQSESLLTFNILETSHNSVSGTAPYLDALQKIQTNPYYFFLGEILQVRIQENLDLKKGLVFALKQQLAEQTTSRANDISTSDQPNEPVYLNRSSRELYAPLAIRRAIDEISQVTDRNTIPVLLALVDYPETTVRVRAIESLGALHVLESRSHLLNLAQNDRDPQVREAAESVVKLLSPSTPTENR